MLIIVGLFVLGIGLGYILRKVIKESVVAKVTTMIIYLLLFVLGISVGGDEKVMNNLPTLGLNALIITAGAMLGSMIMAFLVYKLIQKLKRKREYEG
ncbi:MAG: LysO family transporter [Bacteroidetes bacterium]|nr:LysO family transporter [Bacteroidota bacterium]